MGSTLSRAERLAMIDRNSPEVPVVQCELLSLHRSGMYYAPKPPDARELLIKRQRLNR